jgi:HPt (histidine-containing phosphotransfer) domain-containing protein
LLNGLVDTLGAPTVAGYLERALGEAVSALAQLSAPELPEAAARLLAHRLRGTAASFGLAGIAAAAAALEAGAPIEQSRVTLQRAIGATRDAIAAAGLGGIEPDPDVQGVDRGEGRIDAGIGRMAARGDRRADRHGEGLLAEPSDEDAPDPAVGAGLEVAHIPRDAEREVRDLRGEQVEPGAGRQAAHLDRHALGEAQRLDGDAAARIGRAGRRQDRGALQVERE